MKIKSILVSQPEPVNESSPYYELAKNQKIKIDFCPFIVVEGATPREVRQQKIDFSNFTAVIMTSKNAVDNYFRLAEEMRFNVPDEMKYFCQSEAIALYLQRYIIYRKRKIYYGEKTMMDLLPLFQKYSTEKYLLPSSDILKDEIPKALNKAKIDWTRAILYKTVSNELIQVKDIEKEYDMLVFFSPQGIKSLFENFPNFKQNGTKIAAFGPPTIKAAKDAGLKVDITAPTKEAPSMTKALENFIKNQP